MILENDSFDSLRFDTRQIFQCSELDVLVLIQKYFQLQSTDSEIGLVKFILIVPTDRTELSSFLYDRMEEA